MIFFYGEGRLGNQIFQYQALCAIARPRETIVAAGLESLPALFEIRGPKLRVLTQNITLKRLIKRIVVDLILRPAVRTLRLANYAHEPPFELDRRAQPGGELHFRKGLLRHFTFVDGGYYQNPSLWAALFPAAALGLRSSVRQSALRFLASIPGGASFVHVRRGDYLNYKVYGAGDVCLPAGFYRAAIKELHRRVGDTHLVFVTDDPRWIEENLGDIPNTTITSNDPLTDFAIMTECKSGIVSNSTYSLAAALIMTDPGIVIGPEYWFGFEAGEWYPPRIQCAHEKMLYMAVPAS
jgi:hypothetical protein